MPKVYLINKLFFGWQDPHRYASENRLAKVFGDKGAVFLRRNLSAASEQFVDHASLLNVHAHRQKTAAQVKITALYTFVVIIVSGV